MADAKKRKPKPRAVSAGQVKRQGVTWEYFERVAALRLRLKPEVARTMYALCCLLADEYDAQRMTWKEGLQEDKGQAFGKFTYLSHASSALREMAERLLKSFQLKDVAAAERYGLEQWTDAVNRLNRRKELPLPTS